MKISKSGYINHAQKSVKMDTARMAGGVKAPRLTTWRSYKFGGTYKQGMDWRADCPKCHGAGELDSALGFVREDVNGRGPICFACEGRGWFALPNPKTYKEFLTIWCMHKVDQGKVSEIRRVFQSEVVYVDSLMQQDWSIEWEMEVFPFWEWALRRCMMVELGAPFFTSELPAKLIAAYNRSLAHEAPEKEDEESESAEDGAQYEIEPEYAVDQLARMFGLE